MAELQTVVPQDVRPIPTKFGCGAAPITRPIHRHVGNKHKMLLKQCSLARTVYVEEHSGVGSVRPHAHASTRHVVEPA